MSKFLTGSRLALLFSETDWAERPAMQLKTAAKEKIFLILLFIHTSIKIACNLQRK